MAIFLGIMGALTVIAIAIWQLWEPIMKIIHSLFELKETYWKGEKAKHDAVVAQRTIQEERELSEVPRVVQLMKDKLREDAIAQGRNLGGGISIHPVEWFVARLPKEKESIIRKAHQEWLDQNRVASQRLRR